MFSNRPLILAPLAGITDSPFRRLCKTFGADLTVTEMISAKGVWYGDARTIALCDHHPEERPLSAQLFGRDPEIIRAAAEFARERGAAVVDINMGCPIKKVIKTGAGAALLRDLSQVTAIMRRLSRPPAIPFTVKIRSGWDREHLVADEVFRLAAAHGARAVVCHPRTATQMFSGTADWDYLEATARDAPLPVIGSGDIVSVADGIRALGRAGIAGLMIGRGALGRPWFFRELRQGIAAGTETAAMPVAAGERFAVVMRHWELLAAAKGERTARIQFRKHLGWYSHGLPDAARFRREVFTAGTTAAMLELAATFFNPA
ncbi:MAG: tRNA dihydrouridine synthase DusB [Deltaproteobacteria bacterium]|nr:tRNA dihydrouridine synthase DusB [Candidatus Anaeroferrophillacea bacterium]